MSKNIRIQFFLSSLFLCINVLHIGTAQQASAVTFKTGSREVNFRKVVLRTLGDFVTFRVKACNNAHLALLKNANDVENSMTEIVIGGWNNMRSVIQTKTGPPVASRSTPNILNCMENRQFWMSWAKEKLMVGMGPVSGEQIILSANRTGPLNYTAFFVAFSTGFGSSGIWQLDKNLGNHLRFETPTSYGYETVWKDATSLDGFMSFRVKACSNVYVVLTSSQGLFGQLYSYELVIGINGNTVSGLRLKTGSININKVSRNTPNILSCNSARDFWVSWKNNSIAVGRGTVYKKLGYTIGQWDDRSRNPIDVVSVGFSTGNGSSGVFKFPMESSGTYYINTLAVPAGGRKYSVTLHQPRMTTLRFGVKACSNAWLGMRQAISMVPDMEISIGEANNTKSAVYLKGTKQTNVDTPGILQCDQTIYFFVMWQNKRLILGRGHYGSGSPYILDYTVSSAVSYINMIALGTENGQSGLWTIKQDQVEPYQPENNFVSVSQEVYKVIWIRACSNVVINLSEYIGRVLISDYRLIIGQDNQYSKIEYPGQSIRVDTPKILNCTVLRPFWISWLDDIISFGRGSKFNRNRVLGSTQIINHPITSLSVDTNTTKGYFLFEEDKGDVMYLNTSGNDQYGNKFLLLKRGVSWISFRVAACSDVGIAMSAVHMSTAQAYEISLEEHTSTNVVIRKGIGTTPKASGSAGGKFDCNGHNNFWISWENGLIAFGRGRTPDMRQLVQWKDPNPFSVQSVAFKTGGGIPGEFIINHAYGLEIGYDTIPTLSYDQLWVSTKHRRSLLFQVKACSNVNILLCRIMGYASPNICYNITLGEDGHSKLRTGNQNSQYGSVSTPYILHCKQFRTFWINWYKGQVTIGKGGVIGIRTFLHYQPPGPFPIQAASFSTSGGVTGIFKVLFTNAAPQLVVVTPSPGAPAPAANTGLSGGEIAGAVIGFLVLFILFGVAVYCVCKPPDVLKPYLLPPPTGGGIDNPNLPVS